MAKRKTKNESEVTSIETTSNEQQDFKEIIEDNKISETTNETTNETTKNENDNKITKKKNTKEKEYIITKKSEGVYIRKLRRL